MAPKNLKYTTTHEWARLEGNVVTVGITHFAAHNLADLVYLELPQVGAQVHQGAAFGCLESVKAVSDLYTMTDGTVVEVHQELANQLDKITADPYGEGWMIRIRTERPEDLDRLMTADEYEQFLAEEAEGTSGE